MTYIKIFVDYLDALEPLGDAERGRLFTALLEYARTGTASHLGGNERFIFPLLRAQIDRDREAYETEKANLHERRSKAGQKGGQANASKHKQTEANEANDSKTKQTVANEANSSKPKQTEAKDKDNDKEEDKDKDNDNNQGADHDEDNDAVTVPAASAAVTQQDLLRVMEEWNQLQGVPPVQKIAAGTDRERMLKTRIRDYGLETVLEAIRMIPSSPFLLGAGSRNFVVNFDWFIKPNNFPKVLEGNYLADRGRAVTGDKGQLLSSAPGKEELQMLRRMNNNGDV